MMIPFIALQIKKAYDKNSKEGQNLYRAYFINTPIYNSYKSSVDTILKTDGYADAIVTE